MESARAQDKGARHSPAALFEGTHGADRLRSACEAVEKVAREMGFALNEQEIERTALILLWVTDEPAAG
jgi:hypothetical protein